MKFVAIGEARDTLADLLQESQREPVCITRHGQPVAVITGVEGKDVEQVMLERSPKFWEMIDRARKGPRASEAEVRRKLGVPEVDAREELRNTEAFKRLNRELQTVLRKAMEASGPPARKRKRSA